MGSVRIRMASTANAIDFHRIEASKRQQSKIAPTISDYGTYTFTFMNDTYLLFKCLNKEFN